MEAFSPLEEALGFIESGPSQLRRRKRDDEVELAGLSRGMYYRRSKRFGYYRLTLHGTLPVLSVVVNTLKVHKGRVRILYPQVKGGRAM